MASPPKTRLSPQEYLAVERRNEYRSEYIGGIMVAMSGASREHILIVANLASELRQQLKGKPCEVYPVDMRVKIPSAGIYTYPDIAVMCGEPIFEDDHVDTLLNPTLLIEVLSDSTEKYDRGKKAGYYRTIESLCEYLFVAQDEYKIEQQVKESDGRWILSEVSSLDSSINLTSISCTLSLREVYDRVVLG